jgi:phosphoribosylanthranilate isomerase
VVDALLLDGFSPDAHGGTGRAFPWQEAAAVLSGLETPPPLVAAGGLRPENVAEAVRILRPFAVDVSSGVESAPGTKDHSAIDRFMRAARAARSAPPDR